MIFFVLRQFSDAGGLFRDLLSHVCRELQVRHRSTARRCFSTRRVRARAQSDALPLFVQCPNARAGVGINQVGFLCDRVLFVFDTYTHARALTHTHTP